MPELNIKDFARIITRLINKENLNCGEAFDAFSVVIQNKTTEMQQGAFLAALSAKGETKEEIAGCWEAIYEYDTVKAMPDVKAPIVENSGTGMDSFKTFNISTCASLVAATHGIPVARHGARALTSMCGTIDIAEALGVDVDCEPEVTVQSIEKTGLGLFNGMSAAIHPMALGRILSQISFGSTLNIAASLASPVRAQVGVRGVYSKEMIVPVVEVMKEIGYKKAIVFNGSIGRDGLSIDEASVAGPTHCAELMDDGSIRQFVFTPDEAGLPTHIAKSLAPMTNINDESRMLVDLVCGNTKGARNDAVALNTGMIFYAYGTCSSIKDGTALAHEILKSGKAYTTLSDWVQVQNRNPKKGLKKLQLLGIN